MLMILLLSILSLIIGVYVLRKQFLSFSQYDSVLSKPASQASGMSVIKTILFWLLILPLSYLELIAEGTFYAEQNKPSVKVQSTAMDRPTQNDQVNYLNGAKL